MCVRCEVLEERVAWLESELGLQQAADVYARVREAFHARGVQPRGLGVLAALYAANGRTMTKWQILEAVPSRSGDDDRGSKVVDVWVSTIRKAFGRDIIETIWGRGYRMSVAGLARVAELLEPTKAAA